MVSFYTKLSENKCFASGTVLRTLHGLLLNLPSFLSCRCRLCFTYEETEARQGYVKLKVR